MNTQTQVVYVHGLWMTGLEGALLRARLRRALNASTSAFRYASVRAGVSANAQALAQYLARFEVRELHLVAHSLGGLIVLRMFEEGMTRDLPPGRIVLLGSPLRGSRAAQNLARSQLGKRLVGVSLSEEMSERERRWGNQRELGIIAGSLSIGVGRLMGTWGAPSDGTVFVEETRLAGTVQHLVLPVSHTAMPFAAGVAEHTARFLRSGRFAP